MSSEASDEMLLLLKELSVYKAMGDDFRGGSEDPEGIVAAEAYDERERRRLKIKQEMR